MKTMLMLIKFGLAILVLFLLLSLPAAASSAQAQISDQISGENQVGAAISLGSDPYLLFADDFNDGNDDGWTKTMSGTWIVDNGEYMVDMGTGQNLLGLSFTGDVSWQDYVFELDIKGDAGADKSIGFRVNDTSGYYVNVVGSPGDHVLLGHDENVLVNQYYPNGNGVWYHVAVSLIGPRIRVYINDILIIDYTDEIQAGYIELSGWTGSFGSDIVRFDNVVVRAVKPIYIPFLTKP